MDARKVSPASPTTVDRAASIRSTLELLSRLLLSLIFLLAAAHKISAPVATIALIEGRGLPAPTACYVMTVAIEVLGGLALLIGWQARLASVGLAVFTLLAGSLFHYHWSDPNDFNHFLKNLAIIGGLMQIALNGPGGLSLASRKAAIVCPGR
jgi:putative oxidoreductase